MSTTQSESERQADPRARIRVVGSVVRTSKGVTTIDRPQRPRVVIPHGLRRPPLTREN
jgi:hypothetical protein